LLQRHGTQALFEERAVDFAVTFEVSPLHGKRRPPQRRPNPSRPDATMRIIWTAS
jgi:hypothetical protein